LEVTGKDRELLQAISNPKHGVSGMSNRSLREQLGTTSWGKGLTTKHLSARVSRHLKLLREHGIIRKLPRQNRYVLTIRDQQITTAVNAMLGVSAQELIKLVA
jgi:DNA-binding transcriptional ArsR family regulator